MQITIQLPLRLRRIRLIITLLLLIKLIAIIISSRIRTMQLPIPRTNPTKLIFTILTSHMIAPLILLNPGTALRTSLRIRQNPIGRLRLILTLLLPRFQRTAIQRQMRLLPTLDAEGGRARIAHGRNRIRIVKHPRTRIERRDALAPWTRTPPRRPVQIHEIPELVQFVFVE